MEELCCMSDEDCSDLRERMAVFVSDRSLGSIAGPRRMGRDELVDLAAESMRSSGNNVSVIPGSECEKPDAVVFRHWKDIDEEYISSHPGIDVLFGQDLCHQVPAVVRMVNLNLYAKHRTIR